MCTGKQDMARPDGIANPLLTPGNIEMGCPGNVPGPVDICTVQYKCSQPAKYGVDNVHCVQCAVPKSRRGWPITRTAQQVSRII